MTQNVGIKRDKKRYIHLCDLIFQECVPNFGPIHTCEKIFLHMWRMAGGTPLSLFGSY